MLRFFALWDDSDSLYGETRPVTIQYYLVDDTVEIREVHEANSGRDPFPILMRRQKLPKKIKCGEMQYYIYNTIYNIHKKTQTVGALVKRDLNISQQIGNNKYCDKIIIGLHFLN